MPKEDVEPDSLADSKVASGKAPPKGKGAAEPEELTEEQKAQLAQAMAEREKYNATKQQEWDQMDDDEKFYATAEDRSVEPRIIFPDAPGEEEGTVKTNVQTITFSQEELKEFESSVNDP